MSLLKFRCFAQAIKSVRLFLFACPLCDNFAHLFLLKFTLFCASNLQCTNVLCLLPLCLLQDYLTGDYACAERHFNAVVQRL